jgi:cytochrome c-type biogenesis protein CcmH/NrfG
MRSDSIAVGVAGILFGLIAGWVIGSQQAARPVPASAPVAAAAPGTTAPALDEAKVTAMKSLAAREPQNAEPRIQLGNLYFDAQRFDDAVEWYSEAIKLAPNNVDVSTDLGVSYYQTNQPDRALEQFERSLKIDPTHTKTIFNVGIVKAYGKQDLAGAEQAWRRVIELAPTSPEGQAAVKLSESLKTAHPPATGQKPGP